MPIEVATIAQAVAVISACWAIVSGVDAWKREFIGKRQIELAEQLLAKFFEVKDAIAYIRNPFSTANEGQCRQRYESESPEETELLNRGYVVVERYQKKQNVFVDFHTLKYRCMASFGTKTEKIFQDTDKILNSIVTSSQMLATYYWPRQGRVVMEKDEFQKHLKDMHRYEGIFWETGGETDEIKKQLQAVQTALEHVTAQCFKEPMKLYSILTKKRLSN